jgi:alkaline phosphatase D
MGVQIYGSMDWGTLARIYVLDTRQYRSPQVCTNEPTLPRCDFERGRKILFGGAGGGAYANPDQSPCREALADPSRTVLGTDQERWLDGALAGSRAAWNVIAQNVMVNGITEGTAEAPQIFTDSWAGYPPARERFLASLLKHRTANPVVLTGDIHSFWVCELANAAGRTAGVELVVSSIATSTNDKSASLPLNPAVKWHEGGHNGYMRCELTRERLRTDVVAIDDRTDPRSGRRVLATFDVRAGDPQAHRVDG